MNKRMIAAIVLAFGVYAVMLWSGTAHGNELTVGVIVLMMLGVTLWLATKPQA